MRSAKEILAELKPLLKEWYGVTRVYYYNQNHIVQVYYGGETITIRGNTVRFDWSEDCDCCCYSRQNYYELSADGGVKEVPKAWCVHMDLCGYHYQNGSWRDSDRKEEPTY